MAVGSYQALWRQVSAQGQQPVGFAQCALKWRKIA